MFKKAKELSPMLVLLILVLLYLIKIFIVERNITSWEKPLKIAIVQITNSEEENHPGFFEIINNKKGYNLLKNEKYQSLYSIAGWYQHEYERYTGKINTILEVDVLGPYFINTNPPLPPKGNIIENILNSISFVDFFFTFAEQKGLELNSYGIKLFVYYYSLLDSNKEVSHSVGSMNARFGLIYAPIEEGEINGSLMEVLHELAHNLGAQDKYQEDGVINYPLGFAEPFISPLYPQKKAEVMAGEIPINKDKTSAITSLRDVIIGPATAYEIGWISEDKMKELYRLK